jgi:hypothetical protein
MFYGKSTEQAAEGAELVEVNGRDYVLTGYVGAAPVRGYYQEGNEDNDTGEPQGFLVHQPADAVTLPHFHETNQFQVIVGGSGRFAKQDVAPLTVQYANGHSPYGPIVSGPEGIDYFTLRARWDPGAKYMPASRDKLIKGNQRQRLATGIMISEPDVLAKRFGVEFEIVMDAEGDGLVGYMARFGPNATAGAPSASGSGGQYWVVVNGTMVRDDIDYPRLSCLFVTADEPPSIIEAGDQGLEMLVLQFPEKNLVGLAAA